MGLVAPHSWEDPREDPVALCMLEGSKLSPPKGQQPLSAYLAQVWAQCWSPNPGSDTLLRAYSRVRISPQSRRNHEPDGAGVFRQEERRVWKEWCGQFKSRVTPIH